MSRKKKGLPVTDEPRIHKVADEASLHHERHQISPFELDIEEDLELEAELELEDVVVDEEVVLVRSWESVKDSIETLRIAWEKVHGVKLANSDLYALMHTAEHRQTVLAYLDL